MSKCVHSEWKAIKIFKKRKCHVSRKHTQSNMWNDDDEDDDNNDDGE